MVAEVVGVLGLVVPVALYGLDKWQARVVVRRIKSQADPLLTPMLEMYTDMFPDDGTNYTADEMAINLPDTNGEEGKHFHVPVKNILLAATLRTNVVGFAFCHYYPRSRGGVISYFGIDKSVRQGRDKATVSLLTALVRDLRNASPSCDMVIFELQKPADRLSDEENRSRRARPVLFKRRAKDLGFFAFEVPVEYRRPRLSLETQSEGEPLTLICVRLDGQRAKALTRSEVQRILNCLHLEGYGDFYDVEDPRHLAYQVYLKERVDAYVNDLPDAVAVA